MKFLTCLCLASLLISLPAVAQQTVSGLILPGDDGGMYLRKVEGDIEISRQAGIAVERFLNAKNWEKRIQLVRLPIQVAPRRKGYYSKHPDGPIAFQKPRYGWKTAPYDSFLVLSLDSRLQTVRQPRDRGGSQARRRDSCG